MKIKRILGKIAPIFDGEALKTSVARKVLQQPQSEEGIINIHRHDPTNVGDYYCAPYRYFPQLQDRYLDIYGIRSKKRAIRNKWIDEVSHNALIIGGGGLLNRNNFDIQMQLFESLAETGKRVVVWGAGHNARNFHQFNKNKAYDVDPSKFGLFGVRDFGMPGEWVPCVSCMHPIFDQEFSETQSVGIVFHKKSLKDKSLVNSLANYPTMSNKDDLESLINFIGKSACIVSDSYHASYWAMLMGKKVIAIPNSSKFYDLKDQPHLSTYNDFEKDLSKAFSFDGLLEEYRERNRIFAAKVFDYLRL